MASLLRKRSVSRRLRRTLNTRRNTSTEFYTVYIGDNGEGADAYPIFGTISQLDLDRLNVPLKQLQAFPDSGKYKTATGLKLDFTFANNVLFKSTTGTQNGVVYNSNIPIPVEKSSNKLNIKLEGTKTAAGSAVGSSSTARVQKSVNIGIIGTPSMSVIAQLVIRLKLGKNPKVLSWAYGKQRTTLRAFSSGKSGSGRKKADSLGSWYIPLGFDALTRRTKDGIGSKSAADTKQTLIIATINENAAEILGLRDPKETTTADLKAGTNLATAIDNDGTGERVNTIKVFKKLALYDSIYEKNQTSTTPVKLNPGTGTTVKVRYKGAKGGASGVAGKTTTKTVQFALPAGVPPVAVFQFLTNVPRVPTSFQLSTNGKTFGNSYPLPQKRKATLKK